MKQETIKTAFLDTLPVMTGYLFLGIGFGIILRQNGYGVLWAIAMSLFIYAGSMQYVGIGLLTATAFLSKREQMLAAELLRGQDFAFFGGPAMAEREVCCYVPEYLDESWLTGDEGPIAAVRAVYFAGDTLTHRDFLGALMGCGIKRETVGDIYVSEGSCDFLVTREILPYLLQNFLSAGRTKLHVEQLPIDQIRVPEQKVKAVRDTVSSLRLDGVVSSGFSISRGKAADYIAAGKCELNYAPCMKGDKQAAEGDVITIRGLGKIRLETIGGSTKKGRIAIEITRFL